MANQMIALQARAPQSDPIGGAVRQGAQMINMLRQQQAAERQNAIAEQNLTVQRAKEQREAAAAEPAMAEATGKATQARIKAASDFLGLSVEGLKQARNPEDAVKIGDWLKSQFTDPAYQQSVDQTLSSLPTDPAAFDQWRLETLNRSLAAKDQLEQQFTTMTTGDQTFLTATPKLAGAPGGMTAQEVPGSRVQAAQGITYIKDDMGRVIPMPTKMPGSAGGTPVQTALLTNAGAIKDGNFAQSQPGYTGASGGFATFATPEAGAAAQENLLRSSYVGKGVNTIDKIISRYAPVGGENSPASVANYKKFVSQQTGIAPNTPITPAQVPAVAAAMRAFETGGTAKAPGGSDIAFGQPVAGTGKADRVGNEAFTAMEATTAKYDETIARAKRLLKNPALDSIVGNVQGNIPETALSMSSQAAANALSDYNELLAVAGFQELQSMRDASPTGGALGQVSDSENRLLQQSAFASSRTQDEAKVRQSLKNYIQRLEESKRRVENAYQRTFGTRFAPPGRAPAGTPTKGSKAAASSGWGRATVVGD